MNVCFAKPPFDVERNVDSETSCWRAAYSWIWLRPEPWQHLARPFSENHSIDQNLAQHYFTATGISQQDPAGCRCRNMSKHVGLSENRVYSQWNSHLIGIMIINHWVQWGTPFSDTPMSKHVQTCRNSACSIANPWVFSRRCPPAAKPLISRWYVCLS